MTVLKWLSLLICVLTCSALRSFSAKRIGLQITDEDQSVKVWGKRDINVKINKTTYRTLTEVDAVDRWHRFTARRQGSEICLFSNGQNIRCGENKMPVYFTSDLATDWIVEPVTVYSDPIEGNGMLVGVYEMGAKENHM
ncbi:uncharacterized protein LOC134788659 [Penaeus indicus]|uniref:uncharacterized protein LOC134788659 n=1 Tax=Penaeus indicus TaxID=29960 RepID=UPI00300CDFAD